MVSFNLNNDISIKSSLDDLIPQPPSPQAINHGIDYVIVFRYPIPKSLVDRLQLEQQVIDGLQSLTTKLTRAQLFFDVRAGEQRGTLLLLVGCPQARLYKEFLVARARDFVLGISLADDKSLSEATRLRLIYDILTSPEKSGGADISPHVDPFVASIMPLHNDNFKKEWISTWSRKWMIDDDDLWNIRNQFGEKVAFYFAFAQFYFFWLMVPAGLGVLVYAMPGNTTSLWYSLSILAWGIAFTETWRRKQVELAVRWNVVNCSKHERQRATFKGNTTVADQVTGEEMPFVPTWKVILRRCSTTPGVVMGAALLMVMVSFMFILQLFLHEYYTGPFRQFLHYAPTVGYALLIPAMSGVYSKGMRLLNNWEMHQTETSWEHSYTQKIFVVNFLVSYLSLFLIAWVYIPFGDEILPYLDAFGISHDHQKVDFQRLQDQLVYFVVTGQAVGFLTGMVVPKVMAQAKLLAARIPRGRSLETASDMAMDSRFIKKLNKEVALVDHNIYSDYVDMVIQLRSDALKMCKYSRRPIPHRAEDIGSWLRNLETIVWLSSITMASFAYLFHPTTDIHSSYAPLYTLLSILLSEHLYAALRLVIQTMMSVIPNWPDQMIKQRNYKIRQDRLQRLDKQPGLSADGGFKQDPVAKLWSQDADVGARTEPGIWLIKRCFKTG
ncbi:hypothetical protein [Absidia glauca]|uniref:Anoctamin dimerisation domain-containing protein n=1 Tax=Absidia glauca TaxID=4829 RepID=A0A168SE04_ABSGL|nr:hypothetical protein [Absidia glauca]